MACKRLKLAEKDKLWEPSSFDFVCSKHFVQTDFVPTAKRRRLRPLAVPSVFPFEKERPTTSREIRYLQNYGQVPFVRGKEIQGDSDLKLRFKNVQKILKNTRKRETRLRETVKSLRKKLSEETALKESLATKLDAYKGTYMYCYEFAENINNFFVYFILQIYRWTCFPKTVLGIPKKCAISASPCACTARRAMNTHAGFCPSHTPEPYEGK